MNKDPYDLTPVQQKDIFTYTDMTEEDFEDIVFNCFLEHAKQSFNYPEPYIDADGIFKFSRDLRAALAAANGPLRATTSKPLSAKPWGGYTLTEMEELLQKVQRLETENAALRELLNEPYQFFRFGHKALFPWGNFLDRWCKRAEKLGFKKEAKT